MFFVFFFISSMTFRPPASIVKSELIFPLTILL
jgi:hypothetical protein